MPATIKILPGLGYFFIFTEETIVFRLHVFISEKQYEVKLKVSTSPCQFNLFQDNIPFLFPEQNFKGIINGRWA